MLVHGISGVLLHVADASGLALCGSATDLPAKIEVGSARSTGKLCWICDDLLEGVDPIPGTDLVAPLEDQLFSELARLPYRAYLQSLHWKWMRQLALDYYGPRCVLCGSPDDLEVHHRTYDRRGRELISDLTVLCGACHGRYHDAARP